MKACRDAEELKRRLRGQADKTVVFTNGVFDLLHPGHIELLGFAKRQGDILVIGVNDDTSVRRLKGERRPIFPLTQRVEILEAIRFVDYIVPFSEDTPLELIRRLDCIDVLVKGGDYRPEEVVGRQEVEARGGRLVLFPLQSAYSTSALIKKILNDQTEER